MASINDYAVHLKITDTGYSKICGRCAKRHTDIPELSGKARPLEWALCAPCTQKKLTKHELYKTARPRDYYYGPVVIF